MLNIFYEFIFGFTGTKFARKGAVQTTTETTPHPSTIPARSAFTLTLRGNSPLATKLRRAARKAGVAPETLTAALIEGTLPLVLNDVTFREETVAPRRMKRMATQLVPADVPGAATSAGGWAVVPVPVTADEFAGLAALAGAHGITVAQLISATLPGLGQDMLGDPDLLEANMADARQVPARVNHARLSAETTRPSRPAP